MDDQGRIPLTQVAADMRGPIRAFRDAGEVSFQSVPVETARENYLRSCKANGLPPVDLALIRDHEVPVVGGQVAVREYRPAADGMLPGILFIHGGGWVIGNLDTHDTLCRTLARDSGAAVFAVDYRLAPEHPFPVPLDDCVAALAWLMDQATALQISPNRIAAVGDSAGGNLCAVLANTAALRPAGFAFSAQALLYPVTDLRGESQSYDRIRAGFPLTAASMHWFRDQYLPRGSDLADPRLSPILAPELCAAPLFLVSCGMDPLSDEGTDYAAAIAKAGGRVEHHHLPGHAHGLFTSAGIVTTGQVMTARLTAFLAANLGALQANSI